MRESYEESRSEQQNRELSRAKNCSMFENCSEKKRRNPGALFFFTMTSRKCTQTLYPIQIPSYNPAFVLAHTIRSGSNSLDELEQQIQRLRFGQDVSHGPSDNLNFVRFALRFDDATKSMNRTPLQKYDSDGAYIPLTSEEYDEPGFWGETLTLCTTLFNLEDNEETYTPNNSGCFTIREVVDKCVLAFQTRCHPMEPEFERFCNFQGLSRIPDPNRLAYRVKLTREK